MVKKIILMVLVLSGILIASAKAAQVQILGPGFDGEWREYDISVETAALIAAYHKDDKMVDCQGRTNWGWFADHNAWIVKNDNGDIWFQIYPNEEELKVIKMFEEMN